MTNPNITAPTPLFKARFGRSKAKVRDRKVIWLILPTVVVLVTLFVGGFAFGILQSQSAPLCLAPAKRKPPPPTI